MTEFVPQVLPASTRGLAGGAPLPAPPGTIFVLGADGGYAVPPRKFTLRFGRGGDQEDLQVHVPVGADDPHISRRHGLLVCDGREWWMRNEGRLPIRLPGDALLLTGQELLVEEGYTPMFIGHSKRREHLLEVRVVGSATVDTVGGLGSLTKAPVTYELSEEEHLVLTALAQRYLRQERHPQPVAWQQVSEDLSRLPDGRGRISQRPANIVGEVRNRLRAAGVAGLTLEEVGQPAGNVLNHNLIQALLRSATLVPPNLRLLGEQDD